ncbi:hypothetical protein Q7C_706 [Methylophaga frappieri]|uniref:Tryptophan synthase subunit beta like protein n=1 Tax=Methylophaga frappieri (strain ATCC BAA-2434 / DSM 25690 / JAM7) TaxID=754477 RepID=I1YG34_METFJ|nr:hypothetical protein [Methylophaga frappieri]AFJ01877.1 hypothetical protein Q7C_706 [Methylophaga frappieri]
MAYIRRNAQGEITALFDSPQPDATEFVSPNSPELLHFLGDSNSTDNARVLLSSSDMALIRVLEDLINTLIDKGVILFTDLPLAAQEKLSAREKIRDHLSSLEDLVNDDSGLL